MEARPAAFSVAPLPSKPAAGKTLDFMVCGAPVCVAFEPIMEQATEAVGWKFRPIQIGLTPDAVIAGYNQAVQDDPGGVIGMGSFPPSLMSHQLQELKAEHVPVVLTDVATAGDATAAVISSGDVAEYGTEMGDWIMANSGGHDANVAIVTTPATPIYSAAHAALEKSMAACTSCSFSTISYPFNDLGTVLPTTVVTYLHAHPAVNYLFFDFAPAVDGVPAALQAAGLSGKVKLTATDIGATELGYMQNGELSATALVPWQEAMWNSFDIILRANASLPIAPAVDLKMPTMIMTSANLVSSAATSPILITNYQALFKTAWHVG